MFATRLTEMLGIDYPIIQGGLQWLATARLGISRLRGWRTGNYFKPHLSGSGEFKERDPSDEGGNLKAFWRKYVHPAGINQ